MRSGLLGLAALLVALHATTASAQTPVERGGYLVNTIMTCNNCHTPMGPNGPQFDKALSGGLRFDEPPFDVTAPNITPDKNTGIGNWTDAQIKTLLLTGKNPHGIPTNAMILQLLIVNLLLFTRSFELVVIYIQFSLLLCSLLAVLGVIVLRFTQPALPRPYRVWAYPLPPLVFATVTIWMMIYLLRSHTTESLAGLATMLVGFALYFCAGKRLRHSA